MYNLVHKPNTIFLHKEKLDFYDICIYISDLQIYHSVIIVLLY